MNTKAGMLDKLPLEIILTAVFLLMFAFVIEAALYAYNQDGSPAIINGVGSGTVSDMNTDNGIYYNITENKTILVNRSVVAYSNTTTFPRYRNYTGGTTTTSASWTAEKGAQDAGATQLWVRLATSPISTNEKLLVTQDSAASPLIKFQKLNYSIVAPAVTSLLTTDATTGTRKFDVAYEQISGRAIIAYGNTTGGVPTYRIWNGTDLGSQLNASSIGSGIVRWIQLVPEPVSDRIMMITADSASDLYAQLWNGSAWSASTMLNDSLASATNKVFDFEWEWGSGEGLIVYGAGTNQDPRYKNYTSAGWSNQGSLGSIAGTIAWVEGAADPVSNRTMFCIAESTGTDLNCFPWTGSAWTTSKEVSTGIENTAIKNFDIAWEYVPTTDATNSQAMVVWATLNTDAPSRWLWNATSGWYAGGVAMPDRGGDPQVFQLVSDRNSDDMLLVYSDDASDLKFNYWSGAAWDATAHATNYDLATNLPSIATQPFDIDWAPIAYREEVRHSSETITQGAPSITEINITYKFRTNQTDIFQLSILNYTSGYFEFNGCDPYGKVQANTWTYWTCNRTAGISDYISNSKITIRMSSLPNASATLSGLQTDWIKFGITSNAPPRWLANATSPNSPQTYDTNKNYSFQTNWTDADNNFANATFQLGSPSGNLLNYTDNTTGLVGYWRLNAVNGTNYTKDFSGYGNDGQLVKFPCNPATCNLTAGKIGNALKFDGVDDYINVPYSSSLDGFSELTLETWIYPTAGGDGYYRAIIDKGWQTSGAFILFITDTGLGAFFTIRDSVGQKSASSSLPSLNRWYHVVATFKKNTANGVNIYVNGVKSAGDPTLDENLILNAPIKISQSSNDFNGTIDEVRIYNRSLSAAEIAAQYAMQYPYYAGTDDSLNGAWAINFTQAAIGGSGTYNYTWFGTDAEGLQNKSNTVNYIINKTLQWSANTTSPASPQTYDTANNYSFQINWSSSDNIFANASFQLGSPSGALTNYTDNTTGLVGYWRLNDVNGTNYTKDASGYGNDGKLTNYSCNPATCNLTAGQIGNALQFDGANDYVNIIGSSSLNHGSKNVTIEGWVKKNNEGSFVYMDNYNSVIFLKAGITANAYFRDTESDTANAIGTTTLSNNTWYHIVGVRDGTSVKIYLNGILENTAINTDLGTIDSSDHWHIGVSAITGADTHASYFNGTIDEVRIYNRSLSSEEIAAQYAMSYPYYAGTDDSLNGTWAINFTQDAFGGAGTYNYTWFGTDTAGAQNSTQTIGYNITKAIPILTMSNTTDSVNTSGMVLYMPFSEGSGANITEDKSGYGNNGAQHGTNLTGNSTSGWTAGKYGSGLNFDGVNDYVDAGNGSSLNITNAITLEAWVNLQNITLTKTFISKWDSNNNKRSYSLTSQNGIPNFWVSFDGLTVPINVKGPMMTIGNWYHLVGTFNGSLGSIYLNGILQNSSAVSGNIFSSTINVISGNSFIGGTNFMNGTIDEVRIYNRSLSADEIRMQYSSSKYYPYTSNVSISENNDGDVNGATLVRVDNTSLNLDDYVGYWALDDGNGGSATDESMNNNNGNLTNMNNTGNNMNGTIPSGWTSGKYGDGLGFDGANDYVDAGDINAIDGVSQFTVSAWVKFSSLGDYKGIVSKSANGAVTDRIILGLGGGAVGDNTSAFVAIGNGANSYSYTATGLITTDNWQYWVGIFDGSQTGNSNRLKFYFNGVQQSLTYVNTIPATTASTSYPVKIGLEQLTRFFNGSIDEVRIYNRSLSADEIKALYEMRNSTTSDSIQLGAGEYYYKAYSPTTQNYTNIESLLPLTINQNLTITAEELLSLSETPDRAGSIFRSGADSLSSFDVSEQLRNVFSSFGELINFNDIVSRILSLFRIQPDTIGVYDSNAYERSVYLSQNELVSLGDIANRIRNLFIMQSETINIYDIASKGQEQIFLLTVPETISFYDSSNNMQNFYLIQSELINLNSIANRILSIFRAQPEAINVYDSGGKIRNLYQMQNELINIGDIESRMANLFRAQEELINIYDSNLKIRDVYRNSSEPISITDAQISLRNVFKTQSDILNLYDSYGRLLNLFRTEQDTLNIYESQNRLLNLLRANNDIVSITDGGGKIAYLYRSSPETISVYDSEMRLRNIYNIQSELININDIADRLLNIFRTPSQAVNVYDSGERTRNAYNTQSELINLNDAAGRILNMFRTNGESLIIVDSGIKIRYTYNSQSDLISVYTASSAIKNLFRANGDMLTITDSGGKIAYLVRTSQDQISIYDSNMKLRSVYLVQSELLSFSDIANRILSLFRAQGETINIYDATSKTGGIQNILMSILENIGFSESPAINQILFRSSSELLSLNDIVDRIRSLFSFRGETINVPDSGGKERSVYLSQNELISFGDIGSRMANLFREGVDAISATDISGRLLNFFRARPEAVNLYDSSGKLRSVYQAQNEMITAYDANTVLRNFFRIGSDLVNLNDVSGRILGLFRTSTETVNIYDSGGRERSVFFAQNELVSLYDSYNKARNVYLSQSELLSFNDFAGRILNFFRLFFENINIYDTTDRVRIVNITSFTAQSSLYQNQYQTFDLTLNNTGQENVSVNYNITVYNSVGSAVAAVSCPAATCPYNLAVGQSLISTTVWFTGSNAVGSYTAQAVAFFAGANVSRNVSFTIISTPSQPPPSSGGGGSSAVTAPVAQPILPLEKIGVDFSKFTILREIIAGESFAAGVRLKNSDNVSHDLSVSLNGLPASWVTITPEKQKVAANSEAVVNILVATPSNIVPADYRVEIAATADDDAASKSFFIMRVKNTQDILVIRPALNREIKIDKSSNTTEITIFVRNGKNPVQLTQVTERISKSLARSVSDVSFDTEPTKVIEKDPVVQWDIIFNPGEEDTKIIKYRVKKILDDYSQYVYWNLEQMSVYPYLAGALPFSFKSSANTLAKNQFNPVTIELANDGNASFDATLSFDTPEGWVIIPKDVSRTIKPGESGRFPFEIKPEIASDGLYTLTLKAVIDKKTYSQQIDFYVSSFGLEQLILPAIYALAVFALAYVIIKATRRRRSRPNISHTLDVIRNRY